MINNDVDDDLTDVMMEVLMMIIFMMMIFDDDNDDDDDDDNPYETNGYPILYVFPQTNKLYSSKQSVQTSVQC